MLFLVWGLSRFEQFWILYWRHAWIFSIHSCAIAASRAQKLYVLRLVFNCKKSDNNKKMVNYFQLAIWIINYVKKCSLVNFLRTATNKCRWCRSNRLNLSQFYVKKNINQFSRAITKANLTNHSLAIWVFHCIVVT